jgi:hypothetical protein
MVSSLSRKFVVGIGQKTTFLSFHSSLQMAADREKNL